MDMVSHTNASLRFSAFKSFLHFINNFMKGVKWEDIKEDLPLLIYKTSLNFLPLVIPKM